jgi:sugar O-acyltransferase (sialic acid O-acetyltransferase NeuD family)
MLRAAGEDASFIYDAHVEKPAFETRARFTSDRAELKTFLAQADAFVVCIGGEHGMARQKISQKLTELGLEPVSLVSPRALVDATARVGRGLQAMPGANLHCFTQVGDWCILNSSSCVDHECTLGDGVHIMGSAAIAGRVTIGSYVTIGTNATILPNVTIEDGAFIGAGAVVTKNVGHDLIVAGVPARAIGRNAHRYSLDDFE